MNYHTFGMLMPGRKFEAQNAYRFGFNGKQNDNDLKGEGNLQDYGMRMYDPRLGRFIGIDPYYRRFASISPYSFAGARVIEAKDKDGKFVWFVVAALGEVFADITAIDVIGSVGISVMLTETFMSINDNLMHTQPLYMNWSPGYTEQKRQERLAKKLYDIQMINHQKSMNNNMINGDEDPKKGDKMKTVGKIGAALALSSLEMLNQYKETLEENKMQDLKELDKTNSKIAQLTSKDELTFVEKNQLANLQSQKTELLIDLQAIQDTQSAVDQLSKAKQQIQDVQTMPKDNIPTVKRKK